MEYLIIEYAKNTVNQRPIIENKMIMNEKQLWEYLQHQRESDKKFTVNKIECVLDWS